jgi:rubrerythrin
MEELFESLDAIVEFAIEKEEEAAEFYEELAEQVSQEEMKAVFHAFAQEELRHKARLLTLKQGQRLRPVGAPVTDLKIADYLVAVPAGPDLSYQDALILAMKREKASFKLYTRLAARVQDPEAARTFRELAQEEARHKLRFEIEYDEMVLHEN